MLDFFCNIKGYAVSYYKSLWKDFKIKNGIAICIVGHVLSHKIFKDNVSKCHRKHWLEYLIWHNWKYLFKNCVIKSCNCITNMQLGKHCLVHLIK